MDITDARSPSHAEDVVHDAFLGLYRRWDRLPDTSAPLAYVRVSVVNGCRTALRRRSRARLAASFSEPPAESAEARALDEDTLVAPHGSSAWLNPLWTSPTGDAVLGYWYLGPDSPHPAVHFGLISQGTFRPLPAPPTLNDPAEPGGLDIAW